MTQDTATIITEKKIDTASAQKLGAELNRLIEEGARSLVIDMHDTIYICSMCLRAFLAAQKSLKAKKGTMVLCHVSAQVMEVFDVTGFSGLLTFEDSES